MFPTIFLNNLIPKIEGNFKTEIIFNILRQGLRLIDWALGETWTRTARTSRKAETGKGKVEAARDCGGEESEKALQEGNQSQEVSVIISCRLAKF